MASIKNADIIIFDLEKFSLSTFPWEKIKKIIHDQEMIEKRSFILIKSFPKSDPQISSEETNSFEKHLKNILGSMLCFFINKKWTFNLLIILKMM